jgi:membrane protein implicated in regulation of membrane protease activity
MWIALAALVVGGLSAAFDMSLPMQVIDFVFLALISAFSARRYLRDKPIESADPLMNRRGARLVGETATVVQAIEHGSGRVKLGDSEWIAHGPNVAAGERVRVSGSEGAILLVEPLRLLPEDGPAPAEG